MRYSAADIPTGSYALHGHYRAILDFCLVDGVVGSRLFYMAGALRRRVPVNSVVGVFRAFDQRAAQAPTFRQGVSDARAEGATPLPSQ